MLTAPVVQQGLAAGTAVGDVDVVLDLSSLRFMSAAGLGAIGATLKLLPPDRGLRIRSAPAQVRLMLALTGLGVLLRIEPSPEAIARLGPEEISESGPRVGALPNDLAHELTQVASVSASREVMDAALRLVTSVASATVSGADGASVSLLRHGSLITVASSDDTIREMDRHQYATGEGPCISAATEGHWFHVDALGTEGRWPAFVPLALNEGIGSILSTPLMVAGTPVGALNIYSNSDRAFGPKQQELAALLAAQASTVLSDSDAHVTDEIVSTRVAYALLARTVIAQAQGVLMARLHVSADGADAILHRTARTERVPVLQVADGIVASTATQPNESATGPPHG
jgi:anti-anti-sigma regulatory factor